MGSTMGMQYVLAMILPHVYVDVFYMYSVAVPLLYKHIHCCCCRIVVLMWFWYTAALHVHKHRSMVAMEISGVLIIGVILCKHCDHIVALSCQVC